MNTKKARQPENGVKIKNIANIKIFAGKEKSKIKWQ